MAEVEHSNDGRYIVVGGRRWRATDPTIPASLRQELVDELMSARRAVRSAKEDPTALRAARQRVQHAKVALGERGEPWWDTPSESGREARIESTTLALVTRRGHESSICPSDVARVVESPDWRKTMPIVRAVASGLAAAGRIQIMQRGEVVTSLNDIRGPIRLRAVPHQADTEDE